MAMRETDDDWMERCIIAEDHRLFMLHSLEMRKACVYCLLCRDGGPVYVKFGYSSRARKRMDAISTGCPIPPRYLLVLGLGDRREAQYIEAELHAVFADYRIRGEWFKFDLDNPGHKKKFNAGMAQIASLAKQKIPEATDWLKCKVQGTKITPLPLKQAEAA